MSIDHEQRAAQHQGPHHPRLPDGGLDTLDLDWGDEHSGVIYDPDDERGEAWLAADAGWVFAVGTDGRVDG